MNVWLILYEFYKVTFGDTPVWQAEYRVVHSFPALHFDVTEVS